MVPLHHAAVNGDPNVIEALIKGGAKVEDLIDVLYYAYEFVATIKL